MNAFLAKTGRLMMEMLRNFNKLMKSLNFLVQAFLLNGEYFSKKYVESFKNIVNSVQYSVNEKKKGMKMNKRFLLPVLSTALLAPVLLAGHAYADETASSIEKSPAVATPAAPTTEAATPTTVESAEAPVESPKSEEKDTVILHTNDVHGRIVEEKGVIGDAKLATVIEQERAKSNQTTLVVDAGDAF